MRILFTGASSFTGYWFVRELVAAGHEVVAACRGGGRYEGLRGERVQMVRELCETRFSCAFGTGDFLALAKTSFDVLCHHGAQVGDYRSPDFDPYRAAAANLYRLPEVLRALKDRGCGRLVLTGSVFEANEGAGSHSAPKPNSPSRRCASTPISSTPRRWRGARRRRGMSSCDVTLPSLT